MNAYVLTANIAVPACIALKYASTATGSIRPSVINIGGRGRRRENTCSDALAAVVNTNSHRRENH